ncbi:enoyl-CoA hydratase/isomerase family protein [Micrococcus luteus]|uniref:enoyl-CoA hydratase/isomerase family protein n=1 Tax=Micrococcus luteus TaxID=1270 RepID=UPI0021B2E51F|nr:enoyl-CoA hydratase/isomerase family protein [Micrococcus luteus]
MTTAPTPSPHDDAPAVLVETRPGVVRLTLNRPAKGNALGLTMAREVLAAIAAAEADESVHVLTLTGAGRIFCGGGNVQAMAAAPAGPERRAMIQELGEAAGEVAVALTGSRLLVLAGVNGTAAGAGLGLMLGGDVVLVREDAQLVTAFSALGMTPDTGVSYWLPRVLGPVRATQLLLGGRRLNGTEAVAWGLATVSGHEKLPIGGQGMTR